MKNFRSLNTDFYQLSMCVAYVLTDSANDKCGFEAFYRRTNKFINPDDDFYYFSGAKEVIELMEMTKRELQDPEYLETFIELVKDKLPKDRKDLYIKLIRDKWKYLDKDFHYTVYPENAKLFPYVPAVQFYGPKFIGQILETSIVNIVNGKTGFNTKDKLDNFDNLYQRDKLRSLVSPEFSNPDIMEDYVDELFKSAEEYRNSTSKILLEAGYRRACSFDVAKIASEIALASGWNGTSNTSIADKYLDKINGTMAHSFIMGHRTQLEALFKWNMVYPNSTILSCTYDVMECLELMITYNIKPVMVRIDVEPLADLARKVRDRLDSVGWVDVKIFLSGDLTPERLRKFEEDGVPFDACMAGTSYVNVGGTDKVNAEFVYKLVEFEKDGKRYFPEKKAKGKDSKGGLKEVTFDPSLKTLYVNRVKKDDNIRGNMGYCGIELWKNSEIKEVIFR